MSTQGDIYEAVQRAVAPLFDAAHPYTLTVSAGRGERAWSYGVTVSWPQGAMRYQLCKWLTVEELIHAPDLAAFLDGWAAYLAAQIRQQQAETPGPSS